MPFVWGVIIAWFTFCGLAAYGRWVLQKREDEIIKKNAPKGKPVSQEDRANVIDLEKRRARGLNDANKAYKN